MSLFNPTVDKEYSRRWACGKTGVYVPTRDASDRWTSCPVCYFKAELSMYQIDHYKPVVGKWTHPSFFGRLLGAKSTWISKAEENVVTNKASTD